MGKKLTRQRMVPRKGRPLWPDDSYSAPQPRLTPEVQRQIDELK